MAIVSAMVLAAGLLGNGGGDGCEGPFTTEKYPVAHLVILDAESHCYFRWTVKDESPEELRCAFRTPDGKPTTRPDQVLTLTQEGYDAYIARVTEHGSVNTAGWLLDHWFFAGFHEDMTPDGAPGCNQVD